MTSSKVVLSTRDGSLREALLLNGAEVVFDGASIVILRLKGASAEEAWLSAMNFVRVFESTYMNREHADQAQQETVAAFFDWLGDTYSKEIDANRNRACYQALFEISLEEMGPLDGQVLLDVGCGPGTILRTNIPERVASVCGYDISPGMRNEASRRGLRVLSDEEYAFGSIRADVVLTAYVMHFEAGQRQLLERMSQHLAGAGVWTMNFHKGLGVASFLAKLRSDAGCPLRLLREEQHAVFGSILVVGRREH